MDAQKQTEQSTKVVGGQSSQAQMATTLPGSASNPISDATGLPTRTGPIQERSGAVSIEGGGLQAGQGPNQLVHPRNVPKAGEAADPQVPSLMAKEKGFNA